MTDPYTGPPPWGPPSAPPGYGPPQYGPPVSGPPPPYGPPQYGPLPSYGAPAYGPPPYAPPPAPHRRTGLWIGLGVGALVLVLVVAAAAIAVVGGSSRRTGPTRSLSIPAHFGDHNLVTGSVADDVRARVQDNILAGGSTTAKILGKAQVAAYDPVSDGEPSIVFLGIKAGDSSTNAEMLHNGTDRAHTNQFLNGADATDIAEYDAGPLGGSLKCGSVSGQTTICVWADFSTLGFSEFFDESGSDAAADMLALRTAAEK